MDDIIAQLELAPSKPSHLGLFELASEQGGYFTARQAARCGFSRALLSHHAKQGRFIRARPGLYRLREYPSSTREEVLSAWLAAGKDIAVVSHESALHLQSLSDIIPSAVHLTVPRARRSVRAGPGVKVHTTTKSLGRGDVVTREGIRMTSPMRSILDVAQAGAPPEQVEMAVAQAIDRGLATGQRLRSGADQRGRRVSNLIRAALAKVRR